MIQVNGLKKAFDGFVALNGVDMHVEKGAIYGLVGPNGVQGKVPMRLTDEEVAKLQSSANKLKEVIAQLEI